jgi:hypothetical protein
MSMDQVQCPNCGGYDVKATSSSSILETLFAIAGLILVIPGLIMFANQDRKDWQKFFDGKNTATCQLCKFEFWIHQVPSEPIPPNQQLIQAGRQRLKKEEEKRRRYYD